MQDDTTSDPSAHRDLLIALAYRMLGSRADAEDIVQDAFMRFARVDPATVVSTKAYLAQVVTRLCLDHLKSSRVRRETAVPSLPDPIDETAAAAMMSSAELASSLSIAFMVLLQTLSPTERAVFLLREVFDRNYDEIADTVGKTPSHCRQIVRRAKERISARRPRFQPSETVATALVQRFAQACRTQDDADLRELLAAEVTLYADGDSAYGKARAVRRPISGRDTVAQFLMAVQSQAPAHATGRIHLINGEPALLSYLDSELHAVLSFDVITNDDGTTHIAAIFVNSNPRKLAGLESLRFLT